MYQVRVDNPYIHRWSKGKAKKNLKMNLTILVRNYIFSKFLDNISRFYMEIFMRMSLI